MTDSPGSSQPGDLAAGQDLHRVRVAGGHGRGPVARDHQRGVERQERQVDDRLAVDHLGGASRTSSGAGMATLPVFAYST